MLGEGVAEAAREVPEAPVADPVMWITPFMLGAWMFAEVVVRSRLGELDLPGRARRESGVGKASVVAVLERDRVHHRAGVLELDDIAHDGVRRIRVEDEIVGGMDGVGRRGATE